MMKKIITALMLILWPLNLYLANTPQSFLTYTLPTILLTISFYLYRKYPKYYLIPVIFIGIFETKLTPLPILFCLAELISNFKKEALVFLAISLVVFSFSFKSFSGQTIFHKDYEAEQLILRNIHLYPSVFLARSFQNKPGIYLNKISFNFFALVDPNNYFFGFHPGEITVNNQNLDKYPFPAIVFFLIGIYFLKEYPYKKFIILTAVSSIIALSVLTNFDRNDFILWLPISLILINGVNTAFVKNRKLSVIFSYVFIIFALTEIVRGIIK